MMYSIISDTHFGHEIVFRLERGSRFKTIEEHDEKVLEVWKKALGGLKRNDTFYFLGDFCAPEQEQKWVERLFTPMFNAPCRKVMIMGNHDKRIDKGLLYTIFDEVHDYPIYISDRVVLSHYPCAVYSSQVNVHGHLHGMKLYDGNHICASVHVNNYNSISEKHVLSALGKADVWCTKFLYEPWANDHMLTQKHSDVVADANGRIDLSASRVVMLQKSKATNL